MRALQNKHGIDALICGMAKGADKLCADWARANGVQIEPYYPDWNGLGKKAGILRNLDMITKGRPDACIAFPGGVGTAHMVGGVKKAGIPVWEIKE